MSDRLQVIQTRLQFSTEQVEDSRALRVLVQVLVSIGIASVSVASVGIVEVSFLNLLAILLSALGGYWSWRSRRRANVAVKFILAFGMLMALGIFLAGIVSGDGDTRIRLAELLIQLQVLHSFDMPRRKDLGYSIVIGLILLGVAATVSQTLTLGPVLILFVAIALPVLILDYHSRLGLVILQGKGALSSLNLKQLAWLLLAVGGLGLVIFAALPRLPGYQVRNFPVSDTISLQGEFTGNQIVNPGYAGDSSDFENAEGAVGDSTVIQGESPEDGPGEMDSSTYYGFNQRMNQNLRGSIEPQVMMRVRSQAPGFLRVLAFDRYTGQGWEISREDTVEVLERSSYSYQTHLPPAAYKARRQNAKARRREVVQTYTIINTLPNLIPALYQANQLYFPTRKIAIDAEGSLRSPLPLSNGLTFTVISKVPYRDRTLLKEASTEYSDDIAEAYLQVPEAIQERVRQRTEELLAQSLNPLTDPYEKALFLAQALKQNYTLREALPFFEADEDLVEAFLFRYEGGYPDHFATVMTMMLRSIGIPARLVTGFAPGQFNAFTGYYVVNNTDAHAIPEVYFPDYGWFLFDPIPGHEVIPPSIRDSQTFSVLRQFWNWVAGWLPSPVAGWLSGVFVAILTVLSQLLKFFSGSVLGLLVGLMSATGLAFLGWLSWQGWRHWRQRMRLQKLPQIERIYQQMLVWLAGQGYPKRSHQTPLEYAIALQRTPQFAQSEQVMVVVQAYMRWRYGNHIEDAGALEEPVKALRNRRSLR
ncbi:MAG: transglutaminaseTgpA domain-containing protein [Cyanobacteria bacterium J06639_14]